MGASLDAIWAEVQRLNEKLDALPGLIEVNGNQVKVVSLDELSENLGLIKAGEFRAGNLRSPGDSFSGVRIGYPGFYYPSTSVAGSDLYHIAGVDLDTLAVGISATDGKLYFGAGAGWLDDTGIILAIAGGSSVTPPIKWLDANLLTYRSAITTFNILGDTNSLSFELMSGGLGFTTDLGTYAQMSMSAWAQTIDTGASTGDFYHLNLMNIKAGPSDLTTSTSNTIFDWLYLLERVSDSADFEQVLLLSVYHEMDTAGKFQIRWNPGNKDNHFNVWRGGVAENKLFSLSTEGALWGGANIPDTVTFDIGWLRESAITFNSTATAGIEDPDNEMGKLWLDTDFEMRLTDTAGEDWYVTKSTSTGNRSNILFLRTVAEETTDDAIAAGWQSIFGSDTGTIFRTGEITFAANTAIRVSAQAKLNYSVAQGLVAISASVWDTAGVLLFQRYSQGYNGAAADDFFSFFTNLDYYYDSGLLVPATAYLFGLQSYGDIASNRTYLADNQLVVTEVTRGWTVTT